MEANAEINKEDPVAVYNQHLKRISCIREELKEELTEKRYIHTLGVQHTAVCLAARYGEDARKAALAGLLHDCAKCLPEETLLKDCRERNLPITEIEERHPYLLHGKLGACYAKERYGITDKEIQDAISCHTTGKPAMSVLEEIIFLADYIEPERRMIPGLEQIRIKAFENLSQAVYLTLENMLNYLTSQEREGQKIDTATKQAYDYYRTLFRKESIL